MTKLAFLALAATAAFLPAGAIAQVISPGPVAGGTGVSFVQPAPLIQRGFMVPQPWFGPQYHIQNWQAYGFAQPGAGQRWVRYYGDAYLIDQYGRVVDTRTGLDWDQHGEAWSNAGGIPHYEGRGDWRPGEQDQAWFRQHGYGPGPYPGYAGAAYGAPGTTTTTYGAPGACGGTTYTSCQGGYYGYGVAYPMIIETTTTTSGGCGCCCTETYEVVEEVVEVRPAPRRRYRPAPRPRPRPPAGERG